MKRSPSRVTLSALTVNDEKRVVFESSVLKAYVPMTVIDFWISAEGGIVGIDEGTFAVEGGDFVTALKGSGELRGKSGEGCRQTDECQE